MVQIHYVDWEGLRAAIARIRDPYNPWDREGCIQRAKEDIEEIKLIARCDYEVRD